MSQVKVSANPGLPKPCEFGDMVSIDTANLLSTMYSGEEIDTFRVHETTCAYCQFVREKIQESLAEEN